MRSWIALEFPSPIEKRSNNKKNDEDGIGAKLLPKLVVTQVADSDGSNEITGINVPLNSWFFFYLFILFSVFLLREIE